MTEKLLLIDGNSLAYRAFYALPPTLTNRNGVPTNAVYGFTMMLQNVLEEQQPTHILVAWDAGKETFRHQQYEDYKGGRQKTPSELSQQFPYMRDLLEAYNIQQYEIKQYEADDIIGTLSKRAEEKKMSVVIVSGDKDLTQLASEQTTVYITRRGIKEMDAYTPAFIEEKWGITPEQVIDMKGLMGDPSDNIPGVPGIGEKTALKLLREHGTMEGVYAQLESMTAKKMKENLTNYQEQAFMSKALVTIERDAAIDVSVEDTIRQSPHMEKVKTIYQTLEFTSLLKQLDPDALEEMTEEIQWQLFDETAVPTLPKRATIHLEVMTDDYLRDPLLGLSIANEKETYVCLPETVETSDTLRKWLEDETVEKWTTDAKEAYVLLHRLGITLRGLTFDTLLSTYLVDPAASHDDLSSIVAPFGFTDIQTDEAIYGKGKKQAVPEQDVLFDHIARKAIAVERTKGAIEQALQENDQATLYTTIELPLARILGKMEAQGVKVNVETLQQIGKELEQRLSILEKEIYTQAGETFNINSPKQLGTILFERLGLPVIKKTKTGYSTAADVLEQLEPKHEIISHILVYRQLNKLNGTYVEGLEKEIHSDGKIHTRFQQALTQTGRLSSVSPNLQNIPIRLEEGRKIRQAFVPSEEGWQLLAADYSQIELRVLAHISEDEKLVAAFQEGADIHTATAMNVFGVEERAVDENMRRAAKAVNFGIIYGISDYGLSKNLHISRPEAATFIDTYFKTFPGVKQYMDDIVKKAKRDHYVTTLMNRRRYLPELSSTNFNRRSFAERTAMNTPIQGSAADIIKKAMIDMEEALQKEGLRARLLLQVHDELIFEAPKEEIERLRTLVPQMMEEAITLHVPLKVDVSTGTTWYDME